MLDDNSNQMERSIQYNEYGLRSCAGNLSNLSSASIWRNNVNRKCYLALINLDIEVIYKHMEKLYSEIFLKKENDVND